jgi:dihydroneopterin aldolase
MATVEIRDLCLQGIVGVHDHERRQKQEIIVNISFNYDSSRAALTDELKDAVDYQALKDRVVGLVESSQFVLLEKLANEILREVMSESRIDRATVSVEKPAALPPARSVSLKVCAVRSQKEA